MRALAALLLQAAALPPIDFDLATARPAQPAGRSDEIVVTGRRAADEAYRLRPPPGAGPQGPPRAEWGVGGNAKVAVEGESVTVGNMPANRAMVRLKLGF